MIEIGRGREFTIAKASEPLIVMPDRRILVVGTDHGEGDEGFPGREQTSQEIRKTFGNTIDCLVFDSQAPLEFVLQEDIKRMIELPEEETDYRSWMVKFAAEKNIPLITADPIASVTAISVFTKIEELRRLTQLLGPYRDELDRIKASDTYKNAQDEARRMQKHTGDVDQAGNAIAIGMVMGAAILNGLQSRHRLSRREFLLRLLVPGVAVGGFMAGKGLLVEQLEAPARKHWQEVRKMEDPVYQMLEQDNETILSVFGQAEQLSEDDYALQAMQRKTQFNKVAGSISALYRNAIAAEVLSLPLDTILPEYQVERPTNIASVWGLDHLVVPENWRIGYLLTHPEERIEIIQTSTEAMLTTLKRDNPDEILRVIKQEFRNFGKTYRIDANGNITVHTFRVPTIEQALDRV